MLFSCLKITDTSSDSTEGGHFHFIVIFVHKQPIFQSYQLIAGALIEKAAAAKT